MKLVVVFGMIILIVASFWWPVCPHTHCPLDPIAVAGSAQTVVDANNDGEEIVTLEGSGSFDPW